MVLDRLFLWIFSLLNIIGTVIILCEAPTLYDDTKPIDKDISLVLHHQYPPDLDFKHIEMN